MKKLNYNKYKNVRVEVDGIKFSSKKEARIWSQLVLLEKQGMISNLRRQVKFTFPGKVGDIRFVDSNRVMSYVADFVYIEQDKEIVADAKGMRTPEYKIKKALMWGLLGIKIKEF